MGKKCHRFAAGAAAVFLVAFWENSQRLIFVMNWRVFPLWRSSVFPIRRSPRRGLKRELFNSLSNDSPAVASKRCLLFLASCGKRGFPSKSPRLFPAPRIRKLGRRFVFHHLCIYLLPLQRRLARSRQTANPSLLGGGGGGEAPFGDAPFSSELTVVAFPPSVPSSTSAIVST